MGDGKESAESQWDTAVRLARENPVAVHPNPGRLLAPLAAVAAYMHEIRGGEPFMLPVKRIAESFGVSEATASRDLKNLQSLGVIRVADGRFSYTQKVAKLYQFAGRVAD